MKSKGDIDSQKCLICNNATSIFTVSYLPYFNHFSVSEN